MRSTLYDTVSDRYARFLRDEVLAEVEAKYNIRKDAYSRAITGLSSGAICSFNAAWQMPDQFSRVISWIGSFTSIQWKEDPAVADGGQDYPEKILREPQRNLRVWLQDGSEDVESHVRQLAAGQPSHGQRPEVQGATTFISASAKAHTIPAKGPQSSRRRWSGSGEITTPAKPLRPTRWIRPKNPSRPFEYRSPTVRPNRASINLIIRSVLTTKDDLGQLARKPTEMPNWEAEYS